jgi:hypothetical protein
MLVPRLVRRVLRLRHAGMAGGAGLASCPPFYDPAGDISATADDGRMSCHRPHDGQLRLQVAEGLAARGRPVTHRPAPGTPRGRRAGSPGRAFAGRFVVLLARQHGVES